MKVKELIKNYILNDVDLMWTDFCKEEGYNGIEDIYSLREDESVGFALPHDKTLYIKDFLFLSGFYYGEVWDRLKKGDLKEEDFDDDFLKNLKKCEDYDEWDLNDIVDLLASTDFYIDVASEYFDELGFELKFDDDEPYYDQHYYVVVK